MAGTVLLSTAYLPPVDYITLIAGADSFVIEKEESYLKQTWRNRCRILSANGPLFLSVPVKKGNSPGSPVKRIEIDYSKRWQQIHLRALLSSYNSTPWFQFYFDRFEEIILSGTELLIDLNYNLLRTILDLLGIKTSFEYSESFEPPAGDNNDYRYSISPKLPPVCVSREYLQGFGYKYGFIDGLSIVDLLFNMGPDSLKYLERPS